VDLGERMSKPKKKVAAQPVQNTQLQAAYHFPTAMYFIDRPDFLDVVNTVSEEYLALVRKEHDLHEIYPVYMTDSYFADERMKEFTEFVGMSAWNILNEQGYAMQDKAVTFMEMWTQEHHKHSSMDQHVHGYGSQITGFYFLETPEDCSRVIFHDPRAGKVQIDLPEQNMNNATAASKMINFTPRPGMVIFANAWLAHSFTRHAANTPIKFVHFNLGVQQVAQSCPMPAAEVV
jgi:uncharacterized protein (TIGR02466 family)